MKNLIKVLLLLVLCVALMTSCAFVTDLLVDLGLKEPEETTTGDPNPTPDDPLEEEEEVDNVTPITFVTADKKTDYVIYFGTGTTASNKDPLDVFVKAVKAKTGVRLDVWTIAAESENECEILVNVETGRKASEKSWARTPINGYELVRHGKRIIITAYDTPALEMLLDHLCNAIKQDNDGNWILNTDDFVKTGVWMKHDSENSKITKDAFDAYAQEVAAMPRFVSASGAMQNIHYLAEDGYQYAYTDATKADYDAYVERLLAAGYTCYSVNELPSGKEGVVNIYGTYTKDNIHVFATWNGNLNVARVSFMPPSLLPSLSRPAATKAVITPSVTQIGLDDGYNNGGTGMCEVIQCADGKFIVIDGGSQSDINTANLDRFLTGKAREAGMMKPVIAMWVFTHSHDDHIGSARGKMLEHANKKGYTIESFAYNFPVQDYINMDKYPGEDTSGLILSLEISIRRFFKGTPIYTLHAGQVYYFQGVEMEVLATEEEVYPLTTGVTHNGMCVTTRFKFESGKTAIFLADNNQNINAQLAKIYGTYLKSDVLQMAHHGLTGAEMTSYQLINPDICLWPTSQGRFSGYYDSNGDGRLNNDDQWCIGYQFKEDSKTGATVKHVICEPNIWMREIKDVVIKDNGSYEIVYKEDAYRKHYHGSQTTTLNMSDLTADPEIS